MEKKDLYKFGKKLGLNVNDIDSVLKNDNVIDEQSFLSCGPIFPYGGGLYSSISIYDF